MKSGVLGKGLDWHMLDLTVTSLSLLVIIIPLSNRLCSGCVQAVF